MEKVMLAPIRTLWTGRIMLVYLAYILGTGIIRTWLMLGSRNFSENLRANLIAVALRYTLEIFTVGSCFPNRKVWITWNMLHLLFLIKIASGTVGNMTTDTHATYCFVLIAPTALDER